MSQRTKPWPWIASAVVAAALLVGSMFSHRWIVPDYAAASDGFSPRSFRQCVYKGDDVVGCQVGDNDAIVTLINKSAEGSPPSSPLFVPSGTLTYFAAFLAFAALITSALLAASGTPSRLRVSPTSIATLAIVVAGFGGVLFVAMRPNSSPAFGTFATGWAAPVFALGELIGLVSARRLKKAITAAAQPEPVAKPKQGNKPSSKRGKRRK
jgi:hypothetical protein